MKKILSVMLAICMLFALAACSADTESTADSSIPDGTDNSKSVPDDEGTVDIPINENI